MMWVILRHWLMSWDVRRAFVEPVNKQRREMAGNVILYVRSPARPRSVAETPAAIRFVRRFPPSYTNASLPAARGSFAPRTPSCHPRAGCRQAQECSRQWPRLAVLRICSRHAGEHCLVTKGTNGVGSHRGAGILGRDDARCLWGDQPPFCRGV